MFWLGNKIFHGLKSLWTKFRGGASDAARELSQSDPRRGAVGRGSAGPAHH